MIEILLTQRAVFIPHDGMATCEPVELPSRPNISPISRIQAIVAESYGIDISEMRSPARTRDVAWPRQVAMYLSRKITGKSFPCIGREFGHRDHTTVIYAIKAVEQRMNADPIYRADIECLKGALRA